MAGDEPLVGENVLTAWHGVASCWPGSTYQGAVNPGCTDSKFAQYDPRAAVDDGSCLTKMVFGCLCASTNWPLRVGARVRQQPIVALCLHVPESQWMLRRY